MSKVNKIERIVKRVLAENPITRGDDFVLITQVYDELGINTNCSFFNLMFNHVYYELPSVESITRARRKLQSEYEELRATESMRRIRRKEEQDFREYSKC